VNDSTTSESRGPAPERRDAVPGDGRDETENERLDRNWNELLQEFRVTQTGTQILTGFLLTLPFQQRFSELTALQLTLYLVLVSLAVLTTVVSLAPVSLHRRLFHLGKKDRIVKLANRWLQVSLGLIAGVLTGTVLFIFDIVAGLTAGVIAAIVALVIVVSFWFVVPMGTRNRRG
jgi:hypothetical protein